MWTKLIKTGATTYKVEGTNVVGYSRKLNVVTDAVASNFQNLDLIGKVIHHFPHPSDRTGLTRGFWIYLERTL